MKDRFYKSYLLVLLTVIAVFNFLDRVVLGLVLESIKAEFDLSDSQLGFLTGFAFALFYALAGIPIARWADRGNRNTVVSATVILWSSMVAISGAAVSFLQILFVRIGVAVGEAGCVPPAQSLIAEYYDRAERPRAMAFYWMGYPVAIIVGTLLGGWLADNYGWRVTFICLGISGVFLGILVKLTLREPRLRQGPIKSETFPPIRVVIKTLLEQKTFRNILFAICLAHFFGVGLQVWLPTFYIRSYAVDVDELGVYLSLSWGVCALLGTYLGGVLASRYAPQNETLQMRGVAVVMIVCSFFYVMTYLAETAKASFIFLGITSLIFFTYSGSVFSAIQSLVNEKMRSLAIALTFFLANLIGAGLGPIAVGFLSDMLFVLYGEESLRYTLIFFSPGFLIVGYYYWLAGRTIEIDINNVIRTSE